MFQKSDHARTDSVTSPATYPNAPSGPAIDATSFFDEELVRLRWRWVESHRAFNRGPASERARAMRAAHASADAYFDRLNRLMSEGAPAFAPAVASGAR